MEDLELPRKPPSETLYDLRRLPLVVPRSSLTLGTGQVAGGGGGEVGVRHRLPRRLFRLDRRRARPLSSDAGRGTDLEASAARDAGDAAVHPLPEGEVRHRRRRRRSRQPEADGAHRDGPPDDLGRHPADLGRRRDLAEELRAHQFRDPLRRNPRRPHPVRDQRRGSPPGRRPAAELGGRRSLEREGLQELPMLSGALPDEPATWPSGHHDRAVRRHSCPTSRAAARSAPCCTTRKPSSRGLCEPAKSSP